MKTSEWSEDAPRKAGSGAVSKLWTVVTLLFGEGGCSLCASEYHGSQTTASTSFTVIPECSVPDHIPLGQEFPDSQVKLCVDPGSVSLHLSVRSKAP